jgi:acetyl esterase/lipase
LHQSADAISIQNPPLFVTEANQLGSTPLQYLNRKPLKQRTTAHLSYDEGLHLIRTFLEFASRHTVEELQAFTSQWVPNPQWVKVDVVKISDDYLSRSAQLIQDQLGPDDIAQVGGRQWWQWRRPKSSLEAEWIEMRSHYTERKAANDPGRRVMLYAHGGAYFFGSVDEHRYQMQRHARKLKARVFAPKYRLAPQFPFPCGLQDCLASYLYLLSVQEPSTIILAGDSAGGGMVMSMLCVLRDQGIPLPAGGILISPWVDLTHSFPSVAADSPFDYIPQSGFHHKPSRAWPPPNEDDVARLRGEVDKRSNEAKVADGVTASSQEQNGSKLGGTDATNADRLGDPVGDNKRSAKYLSVMIDGELVEIKDQIQVSPYREWRRRAKRLY